MADSLPMTPAAPGQAPASVLAPEGNLRRAGRSVGARLHDQLHARATLGPAVVLALSVLVFAMTADRFLEPANLSLIIQQVAVVGTLAIAQTLVVLTAGIDLSVGAIMVFSSIAMAKLSANSGVPGSLALILGLGLGAACGLVNGMLVTRIKLPPFIVTLGTLNVFFSLNLYLSKSETIRGADMSSVLLWTGKTVELGGTRFTYGSFIVLALVALMAYVLGRTAWGRHVYATGDDLEAARLAGVRTNRVLISVDLPAPLSPITASTSPGYRAKSAPSSAVTLPKRFTMPRASSTGLCVSVVGRLLMR